MFVVLLACGVLEFDDGDTSNDGDTADEGDTSDLGDDAICTEALSTEPPAGPDCVTESLACGDAFSATTEGGVEAFVGEDYTYNFCFPNIDAEDWAGPERMYLVELEANAYAEAVLTAPCARMGLSAMRWPAGGACPTGTDTYTVCEGDEGTGVLSVTFGGYPSSNRWLVVVDTAGADPVAFRLALTCAG